MNKVTLTEVRRHVCEGRDGLELDCRHEVNPYIPKVSG